MNHGKIAAKELSSLLWRNMSDEQRKFATGIVLECYFQNTNNSVNNISRVLNLKKSLVQRIVDMNIVHEADLNKLKKQYTKN